MVLYNVSQRRFNKPNTSSYQEPSEEIMSEISIVFDDDSNIQFNSLDDALFHVDRQGLSGVVAVVENDDDGVPTDNVVYSRDQLNDREQEDKDALAEELLAANAQDAPSDDADEGGEE
jgi:hypothetical protein